MSSQKILALGFVRNIVIFNFFSFSFIFFLFFKTFYRNMEFSFTNFEKIFIPKHYTYPKKIPCVFIKFLLHFCSVHLKYISNMFLSLLIYLLKCWCLWCDFWFLFSFILNVFFVCTFSSISVAYCVPLTFSTLASFHC